MIALDTNVLVYARRAETSQHRQARRILEQFANGDYVFLNLKPYPLHTPSRILGLCYRPAEDSTSRSAALVPAALARRPGLR